MFTELLTGCSCGTCVGKDDQDDLRTLNQGFATTFKKMLEKNFVRNCLSDDSHVHRSDDDQVDIRKSDNKIEHYTHELTRGMWLLHLHRNDNEDDKKAMKPGIC